MSKKNKLSRMQAQHAMLLKREEEQKAKALKKKRKPSQRVIPKNLVRGASKDPALFEAALAKVKAKVKTKKRNPPKKKKMDKTKRVAETQERRKAARQALIAKRRL